MKAMIFAAGKGTRLKPYTDTKPKALVELNGKPLLAHAIDRLLSQGISEFVINVHHFGEQVISFVEQYYPYQKISISDERDLLLDTGGGLKKATHLLKGKEPVLIYNVDVLCDIDFTKMEHCLHTTDSLACLAVRDRDTSRKLLFDHSMLLKGWKNQKTGEVKNVTQNVECCLPYAFSGVHIIRPQLLELIPFDGVFSIIDLYLELAKNNRISGYIHNEGLWMDLGKPEQLQEAEKVFRNS